jgi:hypothetical protein
MKNVSLVYKEEDEEKSKKKEQQQRSKPKRPRRRENRVSFMQNTEILRGYIPR